VPPDIYDSKVCRAFGNTPNGYPQASVPMLIQRKTHSSRPPTRKCLCGTKNRLGLGGMTGKLLRMEARIAIEPETSLATRTDDSESRRRRELVRTAIIGAGGSVVPVNQANGLVWLAIDDPKPLVPLLDANPQIRWVQLPRAGVENFASAGLFSRSLTVTCAKGAFASQVGEHALMLILASLRHLVAQARIRKWHETEPESLEGKRVTILGGGGIARNLIPFLRVAECPITVLRRNADEIPGATRTLPISRLRTVLPDTDVLVIALALTPETRHILGRAELGLLPSHAIVVNVARGAHIDTPALVDALKDGRLAAAGLDVTDPEPLSADHPLWSLDNVLITSHCADSRAYVTDKLAERVGHNVTRFQQGKQLLGVVDPTAGY